MEINLQRIKQWSADATKKVALELDAAVKADTPDKKYLAKTRADVWAVIRYDLDRLAAELRILEAL